MAKRKSTIPANAMRAEDWLEIDRKRAEAATKQDSLNLLPEVNLTEKV